MILGVFRFKKYGNSNELGVWVCGLAVLEGSARYPSSLVVLSLNTNRAICPSYFILGANETMSLSKSLNNGSTLVLLVVWDDLIFMQKMRMEILKGGVYLMHRMPPLHIWLHFERSTLRWSFNAQSSSELGIKKEKRCPGLFWQTRIIHLNEHEVGPSSSQRICLKHHPKIV